ncbi:hypothetical protein K438DRAFT_1764781 [Mycena galopus ATCC 62051]|nr:hypothetical protein K438DRAFT_1764781 [Mycena galopus ATCC 62051]
MCPQGGQSWGFTEEGKGWISMDNGLINSVKGMFTPCIDGHQSLPRAGRAVHIGGRRKSNQSDAPLFLLDQIIDSVQALNFDPAASSVVIHIFMYLTLVQPCQSYSAIAPMRQQIYFDMPVLDLEPFGLLTCVFHATFFHPAASITVRKFICAQVPFMYLGFNTFLQFTFPGAA